MNQDVSTTSATDGDVAQGSPDVTPTDPAAGQAEPSSSTEVTPPSFGKQIAQLVIIPAVIAIAGILIVTMFGVLAPKAADVEDLIAKISQQGGVGKIGPFSDPRNSERYRAAATLSQMLREHREAETSKPGSGELTAEQLGLIHSEMVTLLSREGQQIDALLHAMAVLIVGQTGQDDGLEVVVTAMGHPDAVVRQFSIKAMLAWPDREQASAQRDRVRPLLTDSDMAVRVEAAMTLGALASEADAEIVQALRDAMLTTDGQSRDLRWNAAVALARFGDEQGSIFVAEVLLNREALAKLPAEETGAGATRDMPEQAQDQVIWLTLHAVDDMTHPAVWDKIEWLSEHDKNAAIKQKAGQLLDQKPSGQT